MLESFKPGAIKNWDRIDKFKNSYVVDNCPGIEYLKFPGFVTNYDTIAQKYDIIYKKFENSKTPPRGNISTECKVMIIGFKPGTFFAHMCSAESAWLIGPSSFMLNKLLYHTNIYPYYTNAFHDRLFDENEENLTHVISEIKFMHAINENISIVFLGSYEIYDKLIFGICAKLNINCGRIWHPAYLCRAFTEEKFSVWCEKINGIIEGEKR